MAKYLFISHSAHFHGAEQAMLETIVSFLDHENCEISVIMPYRRDSILEESLHKLGVKVYKVNSTFTWWVDNKFHKVEFFLRNIYLFFKSIQIFLKEKPQIILVNSIVNSPVYAICGKILGIKIIWKIHELGDKDHAYKFHFGKNKTLKIIYKLSDSVLYNSKFTKKYFSPNSLVEDDIIYNAVTVRRNTQPLHHVQETGIWNILISGRTSNGKGQIDIIRAMNVLINEYDIKNINVQILGAIEGEYLKKIINETNLYGLMEYIKFIPFQDSVNEYYENADIGITTSRNEAFGRVTVEYLKSGMITIGADSGGTSEIIADVAEFAYLYETRNPVDLAELILSVIQTPLNTLFENAVKQSKIINNKYNSNNLYLNYQKVIKSIL